LSEHLAQTTNGRVRIDPVTGDVGIGKPEAQPAPVQEPVATLFGSLPVYDTTPPAAQQEHEPENEPHVSLASVQEPVGEVCGYYERGFDAEKTRYGKLYNQDLPLGIKLYTTQPAAQQPWVGLTDEERDAIFELHHTRLGGWDHGGDEVMYDKHFEDAVAAIEAKLKEKNQ
jgi:hypothetical protein